jgi:hypothetical protein
MMPHLGLQSQKKEKASLINGLPNITVERGFFNATLVRRSALKSPSSWALSWQGNTIKSGCSDLRL